MSLTAEMVFAFSEHYLKKEYDGSLPTPKFHMDLWRLCCSDHKRVAISAPRGHAKSTSVTLAYVLASICFRENDFVMIVSDTEGQASHFIQELSDQFINNEDLKKDFHISGFVKETTTDIEVVCKDGHIFKIIGKGSNQKVRGTKWRNRRPNLIIGDDLENDDLVLNVERRIKFKQWVFGALLPCLSDNGKIRIVGTILHLDSLLESLMPKFNHKKPEFKVVSHPLADYSTDPNPQWLSVRYRAHDPDFSNILWPEKFSKERLLEIKQDYEMQGFPEGYAQEYLNYPIDESSAYFKKKDILKMREGDWKAPMKYYVGGDFAITTKNRSDYTVFVVIGVTADGDINVVDIVRGRWDALQIVEEILAIWDKWKPELFIFEQGMIWEAIKPQLLKESYQRGKVRPINFDTAHVSQDKLARNRPLQHAVRAGRVRVDESAEWYNDFLLEMVRFPKGAHDDMVDALGHIASKVLKLLEGPTLAQQARNDWEYERRNSIRLVGRSKRSGY